MAIGKIKWILCILGMSILGMAVPVFASSDSAGSAGLTLALERYQVLVSEGMEPVHIKTETEILADAKLAALNSYENIGIVDIGSGYLNVRKEPGEKAEVVGKMLDGYAAEVLEAKNGWYHISSGDVEGYVSSDYMLTGKKAKARALQKMQLCVKITTETLNVRTEPSVDSKMWTQVNALERYPVVGSTDDWVEIELDTSTGYVDRNYVEMKYTLKKAVVFHMDPEESLRNSIIEFAIQYVGGPYVWGGESLTHGCDCSGFTMLVYREFGYSLTHYSGCQANEGTRVTQSEMKPGDLIFYTDPYGTINHVTMYIGNGQCVGAQSRSAGIDIRSWDYRTPVRIVSVLG